VLNTYDVLIPSADGDALIQAGDIERGVKLLKGVEGNYLVRPMWEHFNLFVGDYLLGNLAEASHEADQLTSNSFSYGLLARALMAARNGNRVQAQQIVHRLAKKFPPGRDHPRREIERYSGALDCGSADVRSRRDLPWRQLRRSLPLGCGARRPLVKAPGASYVSVAPFVAELPRKVDAAKVDAADGRR
jgi:hypothetical protein